MKPTSCGPSEPGSAEEAEDRLQALRRSRRTTLEEHANTVERLAQAAYSHAFFKSVNDSGLQRYWLAVKVRSLEEALEMGKSYYQVEGLHRPPGS